MYIIHGMTDDPRICAMQRFAFGPFDTERAAMNYLSLIPMCGIEFTVLFVQQPALIKQLLSETS